MSEHSPLPWTCKPNSKEPNWVPDETHKDGGWPSQTWQITDANGNYIGSFHWYGTSQSKVTRLQAAANADLVVGLTRTLAHSLEVAE